MVLFSLCSRDIELRARVRSSAGRQGGSAVCEVRGAGSGAGAGAAAPELVRWRMLYD